LSDAKLFSFAGGCEGGGRSEENFSKVQNFGKVGWGKQKIKDLEKMESGQSYHIYNHANGSENIFREEENYRFFLQQYDKYLGGVVDTYAYCLMPNHFHFLVGVKDPLDLPGFKNLAGLEVWI